MPRNAHQDALDEPTFERLVAATDDLREPFGSESYAILMFGGRLGMRAGEICHIDESWVDWDRNMLQIPSHDSCECGYCRQQALLAESHDDELGIDEALNQRWEPKTADSVRAIPFDFDDRIRAAVEAFFDQYSHYPHSRASVNRRVDRVAEASGLGADNVYPHALRATAATYHAYRGLPASALQSMLGWSKLSTADKYIRLSGGATADALNDTHG